LAQPPSHRSITSQKGGDFFAIQARENAIPFLENWPHLPPVARHPASQAPSGLPEQLAVAAKLRCNFPIIRTVAPINL